MNAFRRPFRRDTRGKGPSAQEWKAPLDHFTTYELMFELVKRYKLVNAFSNASVRQLVIVGRACIEELARRGDKNKDHQDEAA